MLKAIFEATFNVRGRVGRGAELLDRRRPGWAAEINIKRLDVNDIGNCPLGQLYGEYRLGVNALVLDTGAASAEHGFNSGWIFLCPAPLLCLAWLFGCARTLIHREDRLLRDAWIRAIRERTERDRRVLTLAFGDDGQCHCHTHAIAANVAPSYTLQEWPPDLHWEPF